MTLVPRVVDKISGHDIRLATGKSSGFDNFFQEIRQNKSITLWKFTDVMETLCWMSQVELPSLLHVQYPQNQSNTGSDLRLLLPVLYVEMVWKQPENIKWQINENYHNWKFEQINKGEKHSVKRVSGGWGAIEQTEVTHALKSSKTEGSLWY